MSTDSGVELKAYVDLLYREGMLLDEQRWDEWLALYAPDCVFWMPMWRDETTLNPDPRTSLSHIYYDSRKGLEDRIARIRSSRHAPSATPVPRTAHMVSNVIDLGQTPERIRLRVTWSSHVLYLRSRMQHVLFGWSEYEIAKTGPDLKIAGKKIVLLNDDIPTMLDVYCV